LLKVRIKLRIAGWLRSRAPLILIVLVTQAWLASAVHHHPLGAPSQSESSFCSPDDESKTGAPSSGERSNCPTCRLQRTFASALGVLKVSFLIESQPLRREQCSEQHYFFDSSIFLSNRGAAKRRGDCFVRPSQRLFQIDLVVGAELRGGLPILVPEPRPGLKLLTHLRDV